MPIDSIHFHASAILFARLHFFSVSIPTSLVANPIFIGFQLPSHSCQALASHNFQEPLSKASIFSISPSPIRQAPASLVPAFGWMQSPWTSPQLRWYQPSAGCKSEGPKKRRGSQKNKMNGLAPRCRLIFSKICRLAYWWECCTHNRTFNYLSFVNFISLILE